ncbi:MAG TPA: hypothetical protein VLK33_02350 [Terriglobales bacterium]|nr:hypothetical protein [Terriglobales bacterium]
MLPVSIKTIPHKNQRYSTCGDWYYDEEKTLCIRVSQMEDARYEFLVALHELVEVKLCEWCGVTQKQVDDFDMDYEKSREPGDDSEPGDSPSAPYRFQHCLATGIERIVATVLGVDWKSYEAAINALFE